MTRVQWVPAMVIAGLALGGAAAAFALLRDGAPATVDLASAVEAAATASARAASATAAAAPASAASSGGSLAGTWTLAAEGSFVGYRVNEELARIGAKTAVGRTSAVTGTLTFDGRAITAVEVSADLRQLRSDESRRDRALEDQALETSRFPTATFVLAAPIPLERTPVEGATVRATAAGDLTLHGVTRRIEIPLEGQFRGGRAIVVGSLDVRFADFGIAQPRALAVLSVEDHAVIELQLVFDRR